jgi:hypothetical protein
MGINGYFLTLSSNAATIFSTGPMTQVSSAGLSSSSRGLVLLAVDGRFQRQHDDKTVLTTIADLIATQERP